MTNWIPVNVLIDFDNLELGKLPPGSFLRVFAIVKFEGHDQENYFIVGFINRLEQAVSN